MKPDIVLVLSDQHSGLFTSLPGGDGTPTPFLERLAGNGTVFSHAYCNAPLCVPSRCSFLSKRMPHETGIFDNDSLLPENLPTIAHALALAGYETVLAGRMHFKGSDQNHGFERRLVGDITTQFWGTPRTDLGDFRGTLQASGCQNAAGCGASPVSAYDEAVTQAAVKELSSPHARPLFLVVGLYAPHFPYVAGREAFLQSIRPKEDTSDLAWECFPCYRPLVQSSAPKRVRLIRTAYRAAVRELDARVERIHAACRANEKQGVFIYTSDHGDQLGCRGLFGKKTMYEASVRIPLVIEDGVHFGIRKDAVGLLDLSQTILEYGGATLGGNGTSLFQRERPPVLIEAVTDDGSAMIQAVVRDSWKLLRLPDGDRLLCSETDPQEETDLSAEEPQLVKELSEYFLQPERVERSLAGYRQHMEEIQILRQWGKTHVRQEPARFCLPPDSVFRPEAYAGQELLEKNDDERSVNG